MNQILIPAEVQANPEALQVTVEAADVELEVGMMTIDSNAMFDLAGIQLREIVTRKKKLEEIRMSITRPMDEAKQKIMDFFKLPIGQFERAETALKRGMATYSAEQAARIREAQDAARAQREAEVAALQQQAEETERRAVAAAEDPQVAERLAHQAEQARAAAAEANAQPLAVRTEIAATSAGVSVKENWTFELLDINALIEHAAKNTAHRYLLALDEKAARALAKSAKDSVTIPGLRFYNKGSVAAKKTGE
jgi:hypothetical protein